MISSGDMEKEEVDILYNEERWIETEEGEWKENGNDNKNDDTNKNDDGKDDGTDKNEDITKNDKHDSYDYELGTFGMFDDPDPYDTFDYTFDAITVPLQSSSNNIVSTAIDRDTDVATTFNLLLRGIKAENGQTINSTGLTIWRASHSLCDYLTRKNNMTMFGKKNQSTANILELGAGLGLCGLVAYGSMEAAGAFAIEGGGKRGGGRVVMTDGDTDTLTAMRDNVDSNLRLRRQEGDREKNYYSLDSNNNTDICNVDNNTLTEPKPSVHALPCRQLRWGKKYAIEFRNKCRTTNFFHNTERSKDDVDVTISNPITISSSFRGFDVIMASDVIYVEEVIQPLFDTVDILLATTLTITSNREEERNKLVSTDDSGVSLPSVPVFLLSYAKRNVKIDNVLDCARRMGFHWKEPLMEKDSIGEGVYVFYRR